MKKLLQKILTTTQKSFGINIEALEDGTAGYSKDLPDIQIVVNKGKKNEFTASARSEAKRVSARYGSLTLGLDITAN